jgi:hypothetical protein
MGFLGARFLDCDDLRGHRALLFSQRWVFHLPTGKKKSCLISSRFFSSLPNDVLLPSGVCGEWWYSAWGFAINIFFCVCWKTKARLPVLFFLQLLERNDVFFFSYDCFKREKLQFKRGPGFKGNKSRRNSAVISNEKCSFRPTPHRHPARN